VHLGDHSGALELVVALFVLVPCFWGFRVLRFCSHASGWRQGAMEDGEEGAQGQGRWHRLQGAPPLFAFGSEFLGFGQCGGVRFRNHVFATCVLFCRE
jgi:hypothetical protein